ncbi:hypothetical protein BDY19DRAFT_734061 [Irpex rosettiformis]|uniref:Uncharacterized protein n=1 Tax=Irpex rosettiformis TaxID=378272 RepID=A0ACB8U8Y9_9APHY|nr:hypothetical protein BDY19DRAFT_734061 [Irpex rosettiformis]
MPIIIEEEEPYRHHHRRHHSHRRHRSRYRCCSGYNFRMHSTERFRCAASLTFFLLLAAFVLYLLVTLSLPIIRQIYLFQLSFAAQNGQASTTPDFRFGVWGFCASTPVAIPSVFTKDGGECTSSKLGYNIPQDVLNLTGYPPDVTNALSKALTVLLILHPVSAGLALQTLFLSLFIRSQYFTIFALISSIVTAVVGSVVLAADLALKIVANDRLKGVLNGALSVSWGDGVWMIVAAVALSWLSVIALSSIACRCCGVRRKHGWYGDGYYG